MSDHARLLCIMGSGETAPTMRAVHADLLRRVGDVDGPAVMLDTPYGFQENADELNARITEFFRRNVGQDISVAPWPRPTASGAPVDHRPDDDAMALERALERVRSARYVFAGPGSPTYALRRWRDTGLADALGQVLRTGGCVTFASAAAVTLGSMSLPVYEIYKAGMDPWWEPGLGVFEVTGLTAAVIPHFDNQEGGTHDTRYCYLGERRLRILEQRLPDGAFVFGVDEHTAGIIDLDNRRVEVAGRGGVTIRVNGRTTSYGPGDAVELDDIATTVATGGGRPPAAPAPPAGVVTADGQPLAPVTPLVDIARTLDARQRQALADSDVAEAVAATLELELTLHDWSADTLTGTQVDEARALLRGMIIRLGDLAATGAKNPRDRVAPYVEAVLRARRSARGSRAYALADDLRTALTETGIEVRDTPDGVEWVLPTTQP